MALRLLKNSLFPIFLLSLIGYLLTHIGDHDFGLMTKEVKIQLRKVENEPTFNVEITNQLPLKDLDRDMRFCKVEKNATVIPRDILAALEGWRISYWLQHRLSKVLSNWHLLNWQCLPPARQLSSAQDVAIADQESFALENGQLYFNTQNGLTPRASGYRYSLIIQSAHHSLVSNMITTALWVSGLLLLVILFKNKEIRQTVLISSSMSLLTLLVCMAGGEAYLRHLIPFTEKNIPRIYDPETGFTYLPNQTYYATNHTDYWTVQHSNSLGMLDHEPVIPKPQGRFRILVVGDSFVEGQQIEIDEKFHIRLKDHLQQAMPDFDMDIVALGSNGTGQSNQLAFYEKFAPRLEPDLIILLTVGNDFANNSTRLTSLNYNWDPKHPPILFFEPTADGTFSRLNQDPDWHHKVYDIPSELTLKQRMRANQLAMIKAYPDLADSFGNWNPTNDLNMHNMFFAEKLPPVFEDALASTKESLRQFKLLAQKDKAHLLVVAIDDWTRTSISNWNHRQLDPKRRIERLKHINQALDLTFLDLFPIFQTWGTSQKPRFLFDGHWNAIGHNWGARAVSTFLVDEHPEMLRSLKDK
ncbi:SGNH/GDSL hydrolase family protein [Terasakiella pusilla]|uniref:SGNH/GDSL hydrolase family protein n=1 Tax=Terasakiella pusilla TaxID=64973 RepID=UPI00048A7D89|nr:SGNH/GDSL hydrolase family protein [Terasakiella pusilla]